MAPIQSLVSNSSRTTTASTSRIIWSVRSRSLGSLQGKRTSGCPTPSDWSWWQSSTRRATVSESASASSGRNPLLVDLFSRMTENLETFQVILEERLPGRDHLIRRGEERFVTEMILQLVFPEEA